MENKPSLIKRLSTLLLCGALLSNIATAADLVITVQDEGSAVTMADIIVMDADKRTMLHSGFTDKQGKYRHSFASGRLEIIVSKDEYAEVVLKDVVVAEKTVNKKVELILSAFAPAGTPTTLEADGCAD